MKRIVATTPKFIYGDEREVIVPLKVLLKEVLVCYQKCILWSLLSICHLIDRVSRCTCMPAPSSSWTW